MYGAGEVDSDQFDEHYNGYENLVNVVNLSDVVRPSSFDQWSRRWGYTRSRTSYTLHSWLPRSGSSTGGTAAAVVGAT